MSGILIGCEYSAVVRDAWRGAGFDAWSCDLLPTEGDPAFHMQCDISRAIGSRFWDLIILHIECTKMAVCGNRHYGRGKPKHGERLSAILWTAAVVEQALRHSYRVALENPASVIFPYLREYYGADVQYIQPWQHGHPEQKKTGLALWNLPRIQPTNDVHEYMMTLPRKERERIHFMSPGEDRGKERARFYPGFAKAFVSQWGSLITEERKVA